MQLQAPQGITQKYIPECEAVRGLAILLVVLFHLTNSVQSGVQVEHNIFNAFIYAGDTGVVLFFVLSGFLLSLPFFRESATSISRYFKNRALRILPLYLLVMFAGAIYHRDLETLLRSLLFIELDINTLPPFGSVTWSLMSEVQFYLLLPLVAMLWHRAHLKIILLPILMFLTLAYLDMTARINWFDWDYSTGTNLFNTLLGRWPSFLCGMILGWFHVHYGEKFASKVRENRVFQYGFADLMFGSTLVVLGLHLRHVNDLGVMMANWLYFDRFAIESVLWLLVISCLLYLPMKSRALLVNRAFYALGVIAYSMYLWHVAIISFAGPYVVLNTGDSPLLSLPITFTLVVAAAGVSYLLVERPFLGLKR